MTLQRQAEEWHQARSIVEAALTAGYDFKRDRDGLEENYLASFQALKLAAIELRDGSGAVRPDVHEMLAQAANTHRYLTRRVDAAKLVKQRRRSQIERRILQEVEAYWLRDRRTSQS
jgi:hypothetical protein